jgi:predicted transcriptional regulator
MDTDDFVALARRWTVLDALREGPLDRHELQERVGVSRPTIHRQLRSLREANLVAKPNGAFVLTPTGELTAAEFARTFAVLDTTAALSRMLDWLPVREFDFEFARLCDATVTLPHPTDPFAPTRRMLEVVHDADRIRMLTYTFLPEGDPASRQCFVGTDQVFEGVFDPTLVASLLADTASATHLHELLARGTRIAVTTDPVPFVLTIADETVLLGAVDDGGSPQGLIVTDDEVIRAWAETTFERSLGRARQLSPEVLETLDTPGMAADGA